MVSCPPTHPTATECACEGACDGSWLAQSNQTVSYAQTASANEQGATEGDVCIAQSNGHGVAKAKITCTTKLYGTVVNVGSDIHDVCDASVSLSRMCRGTSTATCPDELELLSCARLHRSKQNSIDNKMYIRAYKCRIQIVNARWV